MQRQREAPPAPSSLLGIRPWVFVLLFSLLVLLFLPPFLSYSLRGFRPIAVRSGWDTVNLLLVLFAILCGVLSRRSGGDDAGRLARPGAHEEWLGFANHRAQGSYSHPAGASPGAGVVRSRSSGYYSGEAALDSGGDAATAVARFPRTAPPEEWLGFDNHRAQGSYCHPAEDSPAAGVLRSRSSGYYPDASAGAATLDSRGDDGRRLPRPSHHEEWLEFSNHQAQGSYSHPADASSVAGVLRSRSSSYYPIESSDTVALGSGSGGRTEEWRCYDDTQIYRRRLEFGGWKGERFRDLEAKTIAVDTYVLRRSHSPRSGSPSSSPPPATQGLQGTSEVEEIPKMGIVEDEIYEPEKPHLPSSPPPERQQPRRRRRRVDEFAEEMEVDKDEISKCEKPYSRSPSPPPPLQRQRQARRKTMEKLPEVEVGQNEAMLETRKAHQSPPPAAAMRHQKGGSVEDTPNWEMEQDPNLGIEKPHSPLPAPHRPSPALPPPQQQEEAEEKRSRQKRSGGGADISAAWALFFLKKKGSKINKSSTSEPLNCEAPASSVPPPPRPPPPVSVFHQLLSHKKGVSTNRRIHSESAAASPPPPPPPPPALRSLNWHDKGKEKILYEPPLPPSSSLPSLQEKPSKYSSRPSSPLLPPPPPRPSHTHHPISGGEMVVNRLLNKRGPEGEVRKIKERETAAVSCPSPDVDNKADLFIARCHANWKLEKQNSMREKERRKHRKLQEAKSNRA